MNALTLAALALGAWYLYAHSGPSAIPLADGSTLLPDGWIQRRDGSRFWPTPAGRSQQIALASHQAGVDPLIAMRQILSYYSLATTLDPTHTLPSVSKALAAIIDKGAQAAAVAVDGLASGAGVVTGDVLGTGALTVTAPDVLLPTGVSANAAMVSSDVVNVLTPASEIVPAAPVVELTPGGSLVAPAVVPVTPQAPEAFSGITQAGASGQVAAAGSSSAAAQVSLIEAAGYFAIAALAAELIGNILAGEGPLWDSTPQGQISKELMARKQIYIEQQGNAAQIEALVAAPDFHAAILALSRAPEGTSGQIQFGVGSQYAGESLIGAAGTTETPGWSQIVTDLANPDLLLKHPTAVALFITNLWVQTGPGGQAQFDGNATQQYQAILLSKLPNSPDYQRLRQILLNRWPIEDPRNPARLDATLRAVPDLPVDTTYLRVGYAKLPVDHKFGMYRIDIPGNVVSPFTIGQVALQLAAYNPATALPASQNPSLIMDLTTGKMLSRPVTRTVSPLDPSFDPFFGTYTAPDGTVYPVNADGTVTVGFILDPAYFDPAAALTPLLKHLQAAPALLVSTPLPITGPISV